MEPTEERNNANHAEDHQEEPPDFAYDNDLCGPSRGGEKPKNAVALEKAFDAYTEVFNCLPACGHMHDGLGCCDRWNARTTSKRAGEATLSYCFSTMPWVPNKGKWTKSGPCVDWFVKALVPLPILLWVWPAAFGSVRTQRISEFLDVEEVV